jgi:EmrB/QacA subfamily drug resistance transporter
VSVAARTDPVPPSEPVPDDAGNRWVTLVLVCTAQFMVILDATIVNIALPTIQADLKFSQADLQWVINSYTLLFGGFLLLGGRAADILGRKRIFIAGVLLFSVASLLNGLSQSSGMLVAFRGLQGLGGALVSPAALSIITTTFPEGPERTKALGVWSAIAAGGGAFGLLLGGILVDTLSWQWIFFVNVPIGAVAAVLSARLIRESRADERTGSFDVLGAVLVTSGLIVLVYAIVKAQAFGWGSARTLGLAGVGIVLLIAFVFAERRIRGPLVRLDIFRIRSLAVGNFVLLLVAAGLFAMFFFCSLYVQEILGFSPLKAGFAFLPVTAGIVAGAGTAQLLVKRVGVRANTLAGMVIAAGGLFLLSGTPVDGSYATDLLPGLVIMSFGMGNTFVPITLIATTNVESRDAGLASGLFNTSQQVGGALGLAILSTLAADKTTSVLSGLGHKPSAHEKASALVDGFHVAFTSAAILVAAGAVVLALLLRGSDVANVSPE